MWIKRKVQKGTGTGRKIGFPTINLNVGDFGKKYSEGVYRCEVKIADKIFKGGLFFGRRMSGKKKSLEIHIIGFNQKIYGTFMLFKICRKIRRAKKFNSLEELRKQIKEDIILLSE